MTSRGGTSRGDDPRFQLLASCLVFGTCSSWPTAAGAMRRLATGITERETTDRMRSWLVDHGVDDWFTCRSPGRRPDAFRGFRSRSSLSEPTRARAGYAVHPRLRTRRRRLHRRHRLRQLSGRERDPGPHPGRPGRPPGVDPRAGRQRRSFRDIYEAVDQLALRQATTIAIRNTRPT